MVWNDTFSMPFGKHIGKKLSEVPASYLLWCYDQVDMMDKWPSFAEYLEANLEEITERKEEEAEDRMFNARRY